MDATRSGWTTGIHVGLLIALSLTLCVRAADAPPVKAGKPATITAVVNDSTLGSPFSIYTNGLSIWSGARKVPSCFINFLLFTT